MDLKPCPFCGSYYVIPAGGRMICDACYAFGPTQRDDPFAAWNRRAPDPRMKSMTFAVAEALHALEIERPIAQKDVDIGMAKTWLRNALAAVDYSETAPDPRAVELARAVRAVRFNCPPDDVWFDKLTDAESLADAILRESEGRA